MAVKPQDIVSTSLDLHARQASQVLVTRRAVVTMLRHAQDGYPLEIGGHLVGRVVTDEESGEPLTYIDRAMEADAHSTHTRVTFLPTNVLKVHTTCERLDMRVVGYYHSHPGFGIFQSGDDVSNFTTYYQPPHHIAVVVDPTKARQALTVDPSWLGFFGWDDQGRPQLLDASAVHLLVEPLDLGQDAHDQAGEIAGDTQVTTQAEVVDTPSYLPAIPNKSHIPGSPFITGYYDLNMRIPKVNVRLVADSMATTVRKQVRRWR